MLGVDTKSNNLSIVMIVLGLLFAILCFGVIYLDSYQDIKNKIKLILPIASIIVLIGYIIVFTQLNKHYNEINSIKSEVLKIGFGISIFIMGLMTVGLMGYMGDLFSKKK